MEKAKAGRVPNVPYFKDTLPNKNNQTGIKGVYWSKRSEKWYSKIRAFGEVIHLGFFDDQKEAQEAINQARIQLNSKEDVERYKEININHRAGRDSNIPYYKNEKPSKNNKSGVKGVYWQKREKNWIAVLYAKGKKIIIGYFNNVPEAEKALKKAREENLL